MIGDELRVGGDLAGIDSATETTINEGGSIYICNSVPSINSICNGDDQYDDVITL